jgi:hypothetical protein
LLRHKFADHQGQVSDHGDHQANPDSLGNADGQAQLRKPFRKTQPKRGPGKRARQDADQGNTDLDGRQKPTGIACECEGATRANDVAIHQGLQPSAP